MRQNGGFKLSNGMVHDAHRVGLDKTCYCFNTLTVCELVGYDE